MTGGKVAILGAGGFVGARLLETAVLGGRTDIVPVVRSFRSVARVAQLGLSHRLGDASRPESLEQALAGCETVVNLTSGDPADIPRTTENIYNAAVAAGARRLIHLSSATVYGQVERADLDDDAPPELDHWMPYARAKGQAENFLRERMREQRIGIAVLRPGLIWGPRSAWVLRPASQLISGSAWLVGDGTGICNLMHVDNLLRSIDAVTAHPERISGFYNVADDETTTWRGYYAALAAGLGVDMAGVHRVPADRYRAGLGGLTEELKKLPPYQWLKHRLSQEAKDAIKLRLRLAFARDLPPQAGATASPVVTRDLWHLQTVRHPLPTDRFRDTFGHRNSSAFASGLASSLAWLHFIGFDQRSTADEPVRARSPRVAFAEGPGAPADQQQ